MPTRIAIDSLWCLRPLGSACERCATVCPKQAIGFGEDGVPAIDDSLCTGCALCSGICDAFVSTQIITLDVYSRATMCADRGERVHFVCMEALPAGIDEPTGNVIVLNCLAELPPELWIALLARRVPISIACNETTCVQCKLAGDTGFAMWSFALAKARSIIDYPIEFSREIPQRENLLRDMSGADSNDRREVLAGIGSTLQDLASGERRKRASSVVDDCASLQERMHARAFDPESSAQDELTKKLRLKSAYTPRVIPPRLELIKEAALAEPSCASTLKLMVADLDLGACHCEGHPCTLRCPTHALRMDFGKADVSFDPASCIGCGYCSAICPTGAVKLAEATAELFCREPA